MVYTCNIVDRLGGLFSEGESRLKGSRKLSAGKCAVRSYCVII